jgi:glycerol-3-phosphate cytidylyltransferase
VVEKMSTDMDDHSQPYIRSSDPIEVRSLIEGEFDTAFYVQRYLDLAETVKSDPSFDLVGHFLEHGWREGRDPNGWFSSADYLSRYPDVAESGMVPFLHYLRHGRRERRLVTEDDETMELVRGEFDVEFYQAQIRECPQASATPTMDPIEHYLECGWRIGLNPNELFVTSDYLAANPDLKDAAINPFVHYLRFGRKEGRHIRMPRFRNDLDVFLLPLTRANESRQNRTVIRTDHSLLIRPMDGFSPEVSLRRATRVLGRSFAFSDGVAPNWWVGVGTALGMIRNGGFIAGDTDIDIRIGLKYRGSRGSRAATAEVVEAFEREGFALVRECYFDGLVMQTAFCDRDNNGIIADVYYFYEGISEGHFINVNGVSLRKKPRHLIDRKQVFDWPTDSDIKVFVPSPSEEYLSWRFGSEWKIPKQNSELTDIDNQCLLPVPRSTVLTYGTFDVFHEGHMRLLQRAAEIGDHLVVGIVSDGLCRIKGKTTWDSEEVRRKAIAGLPFVDEVFIQRELDQKEWDIDRFGASFLVVGDDWKGHPRFEQVRGYRGVQIVYLKRTPGISSTMIKQSAPLVSGPESGSP